METSVSQMAVRNEVSHHPTRFLPDRLAEGANSVFLPGLVFPSVRTARRSLPAGSFIGPAKAQQEFLVNSPIRRLWRDLMQSACRLFFSLCAALFLGGSAASVDSLPSNGQRIQGRTSKPEHVPTTFSAESEDPLALS